MAKNELRRFTDRWQRDIPDQKDQLLQHLELLLDITRKVSSFEMLDEAFDVLERIIGASTNADRCRVYINDETTDEFYLRVKIAGVMRQFRMLNTQGIAGKVFRTCQPIMVNNIPDDPDYDNSLDLDIGYEVKNLICCPLRTSSGQIIGVIQALNHKNGEFTQDELDLLQNLASHAAITLESAIRADQITRSREEEMAMLNVVSDVTTELDLSSLIYRVISETINLLRAERATLFLHDPKTNELFSRIGTGLDATEIRIPSNAGIAGAVFQSGETINIPHAYADLRFNPAVDKQTGFFTRSILCVPLIGTNGQRIGVTQVLNKRGGPFSDEDEARLKAFTAQIAIGLENANLFNDVQNIKHYNESMLQSMTNGVLTLSDEHIIVTCNDAVINMFELTDEQILGQQLEVLFTTRSDWLMERIEQVIDSHESFSAIDVEVEHDHKTLSVNLVVHPLISPEDEIMGTMIMIEDLSHEKRLKSTMSRYLDPVVADKLLADAESSLGGQSAEATLLFSDIRSFTTLSEELGPQGTVQLLNEYFTEMMDCVVEHNGILDKFIGDAIMAVFGIPEASKQDPDNALNAAIQMHLRLKEFNVRQLERDLPEVAIGVGINTGAVMYGNIGSPKRMDFTVIGDGVNVASRLESACKHYGSKILISEDTKNALNGIYRLREVDIVQLKGKLKPTSIYEVLDIYDQTECPSPMDLVELTRAMLKAYCAQNWSEAEKTANKIHTIRPDDAIARLYLKRCELLKAQPPGDEWNGVWVMTDK